MMKFKVLATLLLSFWASSAFACPMCGQSSNEGDQYLVYILGVFVLLTYIPMFYLYKLIKKNQDFSQRKLEQAIKSEGT